jgi:hypothetical protein
VPAQVLARTHDFNHDGQSDITWRDNSGNVGLWLMNGAAVVSAGVVGEVPQSSVSATSTAMASMTCFGAIPAATPRCGS